MGKNILTLEQLDSNILGITDRGNDYGLKTKEYKDEKNAGDLNRRAAYWDGNVLKSTYARLLIRNKHPRTI